MKISKKQKFGISIFFVLIIIGICYLFFDFIEIPEPNGLNILLLSCITIGFLSGAYQLSKPENGEVGQLHSHKDIYHLFCEYFLLAVGHTIFIASYIFTCLFGLFQVSCILNIAENCHLTNISEYYLLYSLIFIIIAIGYNKKRNKDEKYKEKSQMLMLQRRDDEIKRLREKLETYKNGS